MPLELAFVVTATATVLLAVFSVMQMAIARRSADNASLPVVVPHEVRQPTQDDGAVNYHYVLRNEGRGTALNVEHGVELETGRLSFGEEGSPYKFRTVREGETAPPGDGTPTPDGATIDPLVVVATDAEDIEPRRVYWARFRSLHGETFETRNAYDRSSDLEFRRISHLRRVLARLQRSRRLATRIGRLPLTPHRWRGRRAHVEAKSVRR